MGLVRLVFFGAIGLTIVYFLIAIYSRSVRREKLEDRWAAEHGDKGDTAARAAFIEKGMAEYDSSIRPKLLLLVYVVPTVLVIAIHYLTTYY
ncbi:hypothetical protein N4R57_21815 [Rhodobacteraceae bacterium D3-12]|nr:hypothetical protein N4R57_21815 [Rhodobacteraceae bacterium D3-12]